MSQAAFDALRATFDALREVKAPPTPVAVALSEADALLAFLRDDDAPASPSAPKPGATAVAKLLAVGLPADHIARFAQATDALRFAQRLHTSQRRTRAATSPTVLSDARTLRDDVLAACRWNLRLDRVALSALPDLSKRNSAAALSMCLSALARFLIKHAPAFASDTSFDPLQRAAACDQAATLVRDASARASGRQDAKRDASNDRDRAWTHFKALLHALRDAAQYALRDDPDALSHFFSAHKQKLNRTARANAKAKPKAPKAPKAPRKTPKATQRTPPPNPPPTPTPDATPPAP